MNQINIVIKFVLISMLISNCLSAQAVKEAVILINEVPTKVLLTAEGEFSSLETVPGYMDGFIKSPKDLADIELSPNIKQYDNTNIVSSQDYLSFQSEQSILNERQLEKLHEILNWKQNSQRTNVMLQANYLNNSETDKQKALNRLNSCKAAFIKEGFSEKSVFISLSAGSYINDKVYLFIK